MTALTVYHPPSAGELEQTWLLAERFSKTEFVPAALKGKPEAVMACMLAGRELGVGPMQALQKIHIIQGRPTLSAELMASLVRRAGHRIRTIERSNTAATVEGARADDPDAVEKVTWTIDDAKRANLIGKDNWKQYPSAMLWARAVSALCRQLFPDVLAGMSYTPDEVSTETVWGEVEEDSPGGGAVTPTPAPPPATPPPMPTHDQVEALRDVDDARQLLIHAPGPFRTRVKLNVSDGDDELWRQFWKQESLPVWKDYLHDAITDAITEMSGADSRTPPAVDAAPDSQSPPAQVSKGKAHQAGGDTTLQGGEGA